MKGDSTFYFITEGVDAVLQKAKEATTGFQPNTTSFHHFHLPFIFGY